MEECYESSVYERSMLGKAFLSEVLKLDSEGEIDEFLSHIFDEDDEDSQVKMSECILNIYHFCYFTGCVESEFNKREPCKECGKVMNEETYSKHVLDELRILRDSVGTLYVLAELESMKDLTCSPGDFFKEFNTIISVSYTHLTLPTNREV